MKGMATCKVCGRDFALMAEEHYVVSDPKKTGVIAALVNEEVRGYDAFDCPHCGCQYVAQERKPFAVAFEEYPSSSDNEDDEESEHFKSYLEHLKHSDCHGCSDCKYELLGENEEPCVNCIHCWDENNTCKYVPKEDK